MGNFSATNSKDAFSSGVAGIMDTAKGMVQGGLGATQSALVGTKEAVSGGVMGTVGMAKGLVKGGLDTSKTVFTNTKDTVTTGLMGAANMAKGTVQTGLDTSKSVLTGTKGTICAGVTGVTNMAKGIIQKGVDPTKDTQSTMLAQAANVVTNATYTGVHTIPSSLVGCQATMFHEPSSYRATNQGVEQATLTSAESLPFEISNLSETHGLGLVTEPIPATKDLGSGVVSSVHAATRSVEECGQLAATGFAALRDELKGLGDIFQPMTAEEQGEYLPLPITSSQGLGFGETHPHCGCPRQLSD